jgi:hypothetical protein
MSISSELIQEFVKITNDSSQPTNTEETVQGTVRESNGVKYVQLDGSDQLTPVTTTMDVSDGDRVTVLIKNHTATITGNITSPAAKQVVVQNVNDKLDIAYGRIGDLSADTLNITQQLNAASADIEKLEADVANIGSVSVEYLEANYTKTYDLKTTYATIEELTAVNAKIDNLDVGDLTADFVKTDVFEAATARIDALETNQLTIGQLDAKYATIVNLDAAVARIRTLESTQITTDYLSANYATISALNASELKVTNYIDTVEINGNRITAGTLTVDRLIVRGSTESIVYELNNITGALQAKSVDTLNGEIVTPRTINADKVIAGSITTTELNVNEIFANSAVITKLVAQDAFINAISTNSIVVGASNVAASAQAIANTANGKANDALTSINKISSIKYVETTYSTTFAQLKGWAEEGKSGSWSVPSTADMRVGDTLYLRCTNTTTSRYIYIAVTVTQINHATSINAVSHGFIDPAATDAAASAQGTANTANSNASTALSTANTASTNASTALSTANTASTNASTALSTANTANSTANTAKTAATNATNVANSAVGAANAITSNIYVSGTTEINGGKIRTGTIDVDSIDANSITSTSAFITSIFAQDITATGTIAGATLIVNSGTLGTGDAKLKVTDDTCTAEYYANGLRLTDSDSTCVADLDISGGYCQLYMHDDDGHDLLISPFEIYFGGFEGASTYIGPTGIITDSGRFDTEISCNGEIRSSNAVAFRSAYGNYGAFLYNNGDNVFLMLTNSGDQYGTYNSLRPLYVNCSTGAVTMACGLSVTAGGLTTSTNMSANASIVLANNVGLYGKNNSGTAQMLAYVDTSNYMKLGYGASSRLLLGSSANTPRIQISTSGRIDLLAYASTTDTTTDGAIGISISNSGMTGAKTTLRPCQAGKASLGDATYYWKNLHCQNIYHSGNITLFPGGNTSYCLVANYSNGTNFYPNSNGSGTLGTSTYKWKAVYAATGSIQTSDRRYKRDLEVLDERYDAMARLLVAKSYIMDIVDEKRRVGYIAQEVESLALSAGLRMDECSFISKDWVEREDYTGWEYSLDYSQIHTVQIASLQKQVNELTQKVMVQDALIKQLQLQQLEA